MKLTSMRNFLDYIEKAIEYGLEIELNEDESPKLVVPKQNPVDQWGVWAKEYSITTWNGNGQGFQMMKVYTKSGANLLRFIFDEYTTDVNPKRYTEVTKNSNLYNLTDLENFIRLRKAELGET